MKGRCKCGHWDGEHFDEVRFCTHQTPAGVNCGCQVFRQEKETTQ